MPGHRRKLLSLCIAASLLSGLSTEAAAIGVGEIHLQSFLGAPLQAEIPLNHLGELSIDQLKVQLASPDDYGAMGVDYSYLHSQLKIEPVVRNGQAYVRVSTRESIAEPYLNFVLNLRWPQGQLVREFTVLLDPPTQAVAATAPVSPPPAATRGESSVAASAAEKPASARRPAPVSASENAIRDGQYTIRRGDSLWRIASRMQAQAPVEQVMAAILAGNSAAFINGNPNLLKEGVTIVLPEAAQIAAAATDLPVAEPAAQLAAAASVPVSETASDAPAPALVEENTALKARVSDLTGNVAALNENLAQSEKRLQQLESQLNELILQMQQQRTTVAALRGATQSPAAELAPGTGSVISQVNAADFQGQGRAHTPWWVHLLYWLGIGGAVTWAVREHFWPQRRLSAIPAGDAPAFDDDRGQTATALRAPVAPVSAGITSVRDAIELEIDELPLSLETSGAPDHSSLAREPAPQLVGGSDDPVDASISAGVFVAFGRYGEAEGLLREALVRDPARIDLKLQLLDVLMQSDQPGAFDDLAAEIEAEARTPEALAELAVLRDSYRPHH